MLDPFDIGVALPVDDGLDGRSVVEIARSAEQSGYGMILAGEVGSFDAMTLLGAIATVTSQATIGTAVVGIPVRSLALTAMGFAALCSLAPRRVVAGLGVSSRAIVEQWHGRSFDPPLAQVRSFVPALRLALSGTRLDVDSRSISSRGFQLRPPVKKPPPVYLAALNPQMLDLAGQLADGVLLAWSTPEEAADHSRRVRRAAAEAGRPADAVRVVAAVFAHTGPDSAEARDRMRRRLLQYASSPGHYRRLSRLVPRLDAALARWRLGDRAGALSLVPDDGVDCFAAIGGPTEVAERLAAFREAGVDLPVVYPLPAGGVAGVQESLGAIHSAVHGGGR